MTDDAHINASDQRKVNTLMSILPTEPTMAPDQITEQQVEAAKASLEQARKTLVGVIAELNPSPAQQWIIGITREIRESHQQLEDWSELFE